MKLVLHPSHGRRIERRLLLILIASLVFALVGWLVSRNTTGNLSLAAMWASVAVLGSFGTGFKLLQNYMSGNEGEDALVRKLELLGDEYTVVTNWQPPNEKRGDVDLIALGPHGVAVLECKRYSCSFGCHGDFWYLQMDNGYKKRIKRLSSQTRGHILSVQRHMKRNKITASVNGALVFSSLRKATIVNPKAHIIDADDAVDFIYSLPRTGEVGTELFGESSINVNPSVALARQNTCPKAACRGLDESRNQALGHRRRRHCLCLAGRSLSLQIRPCRYAGDYLESAKRLDVELRKDTAKQSCRRLQT